MPATITLAPPPVVFSRDPVWFQIQSGVALNNPATAIFTFTGTGPSDGQTLRLQWAGRDLTWTAKTSPDTGNPFEWPLFSGTLASYVDAIAEILRACETITDYWDVIRLAASPAEGIILRQKRLEPVAVVVSDTMTNVDTLGSVEVDAWQEESLRLVLQVWRATDNPSNDILLGTYHAPYRTSDRSVDLDISSAFSELLPALPPTYSMNDTPPYTGGQFGEVNTSWMPYYIRYADKYGNPAQARAMQKSTVKYALLGATAGDSFTPSLISIRHNYRGRNLQPYRKPVVCDQPDWVYLWTGEIPADSSFWISLLVRWDNGDEETITVTDPDMIQPNRLYWLVAGFKQLGLDTLTVPSGASRVVEYDWYVYSADEGGTPLFGPVQYRVEAKNDYDWFLIFDNGVTGCETVCMRGPRQAKYEASGDTFEVERTPEWTPEQGDYRDYNRIGRKSWEVSTGSYDRNDPYLEHLLHLPLTDAWLMDQLTQRYLRVRIEAREMVWDNNSDNLASLTFTIRAAWRDPAYNI